MILGTREGEELKAPRHASAAAARDRNLRQIAGTKTSLGYSLPTLPFTVNYSYILRILLLLR